MVIEITHGFGKRAHDLEGLFRGVNKLSTFISRVQRQSTIDPLRYDPDNYKGDAFEFLCEILIKTHAWDNRLGITDYKPVKSIDDNGTDGIGINISGEKCVVQIKFRSNSKKTLTANEDKLANLISDGMMNYGVYLTDEDKKEILNKKKSPKHYVITTAKGLHHYTDKDFFKGMVHCIGYNELRVMLDNNLSFWNVCREFVKELI